ncbi:MAG: hypothetical protein HUJ56_05075 [Erysipelotrichaceae bacterium]|nr:hypothetical protein [Erysipelotrichaceae bacterium]
MKKIFKVMMAIFLLFAAACSSEVTLEEDLSHSDEKIKEENRLEDEDMKHEIIRVKCIEDNDLIAINWKEETYLIPDCAQYHIDFEVDQRIGISYTEKSKNEMGQYILAGLKVTKEDVETIPVVVEKD